MSREEQLYLSDMLRACAKIRRFVTGLDREEFLADEKTYDAVLRNLQIIGEAAKRTGAAVRKKTPTVNWRKIAGFRDIVVHEYFGIDDSILWDIVRNKVPELEASLSVLVDEGRC